MRKLYSIKRANIVVSEEIYRQIVSTTGRMKKSVFESTHEPRKKNLSQLKGVTMYNEKEVKMFDLGLPIAR